MLTDVAGSIPIIPCNHMTFIHVYYSQICSLESTKKQIPCLLSKGNERKKHMERRKMLYLLLAIFLWIGHMPLSGQVFLISIRAEGATEVCQGESITAILSVYYGTPPFTVVINDNDGEYLTLKDVQMPYTFEIYPEKDNTYYIADAYDAKDRKGRAYGSIEATVHPSTPVSIVLNRTAFLVTEPGFTLTSNPAGGTFSGKGISANKFYPAVATTVGSPHLITCTYENQYGCVSTDTKNIYVLSGQSSVALLSGGEPISTFCNDGAEYTIDGENNDGLSGSFALYRSGSSTPVTGHISDQDPNDNRATLLSDGLLGNYEIVYTYGIGGLELEASTEFSVLDAGVDGIENLPLTVCKNDKPYPLVPRVSGEDPGATYSFTGPGVTGSQGEGYFFDPGSPDVPADIVEISLNYNSSNGCNSNYSTLILVGRNPEVGFGFAPACIDVQGGQVQFENLTAPLESVETWSWDFGDPSSGDNNVSDQQDPEHFYTAPGPRSVTLRATTYEGCSDEVQMEAQLFDNPVADFTYSSDCYAVDQNTSFLAAPSSEYAEIDTLIWTIRNLPGDILEVIGKDPQDATLEYVFPSMNTYKINLSVGSDAGCAGEVTKQLDLIPLQVLTPDGFEETFNLPPPGWKVESSDQLESWVLGEPDFAGFEPVQNDQAWYTELPGYSQGVIEHSWVRSPCFDFSQLRNPVIGLALMKSFLPQKGGAVLQYQELGGGDWKTLGSIGGGTNWYNLSGIQYLPGGSETGWGLELFEPDTEWVAAEYPAGILGGKHDIKFRMAIASGGAEEISPGTFNQGFAFDNFTITESMRRRSVLEYFTNAAGTSMFAADSMVKAYSTSHTGIVYDLHYHMDYPEEDPMNAYNPLPPLARSINYGVPVVPYAVLNGGVTSEYRYNLVPPDGMLSEEILKGAASEAPVFDLSLTVDYGVDRLEGTVNITCLDASFNANLQLYLVVIEKAVTSYPGLSEDGTFRNVVLDMIPSPSGQLLGNNWNVGTSMDFDFSWEYVDFLEDMEDLRVVAFVQDRDHGWVLQADAVDADLQVGTAPAVMTLPSMEVYPNPARDQLTVYFGNRTRGGGELEVVDISGRQVMIMRVQEGLTTRQLDISRLPEGLFMVLYRESGMVQGHARFIRYR
jgi:hypothetical protein